MEYSSFAGLLYLELDRLSDKRIKLFFSFCIFFLASRLLARQGQLVLFLFLLNTCFKRWVSRKGAAILWFWFSKIYIGSRRHMTSLFFKKNGGNLFWYFNKWCRVKGYVFFNSCYSFWSPFCCLLSKYCNCNWKFTFAATLIIGGLTIKTKVKSISSLTLRLNERKVCT